ncbi:hypothetical protein ACVIHC_002201 [Bradyrhizobium diazoefficiens]
MKDTEMVRIKMLRAKHGSPDGYSVVHYEKDTEHDVPESLAKTFVEDDKVAERLDDDAPKAEKVAEKAVKPPKNKAEKVPENKSGA